MGHRKTGKLKAVQFAPALMALSVTASAAVASPSEECSRACLSSITQTVIDSIGAGDPMRIPLAPQYRATENSVPAALPMMTIWQTATGVNNRYAALDPVSGQAFFEASVQEGPHAVFLFGRLRVEDRKVSELEIYENRSRSKGGFQFGPEGADNMPIEWTQPVSADRLPTRSQLETLGQSIFDASIDAGMAATDDCVLMENGKVVEEHQDVAKDVGGGDGTVRSGKAYQVNANGTVPIPCGIPPQRPTDSMARVPVIDEVQGVVVAMGTVNGTAQPYLVTSPTLSAFVPDQILAPYLKSLKTQQAEAAPDEPALMPMRATGATMQLVRVYDGKMQGMQLLVNLGAPGGRSPWLTDAGN